MPLSQQSQYQDDNTTQIICILYFGACHLFTNKIFMKSEISSMPDADSLLYLSKGQQEEIQRYLLNKYPEIELNNYSSEESYYLRTTYKTEQREQHSNKMRQFPSSCQAFTVICTECSLSPARERWGNSSYKAPGLMQAWLTPGSVLSTGTYFA